MIAIPALLLSRKGAIAATLLASASLLLLAAAPILVVSQQQQQEGAAARESLRSLSARVAAAPALRQTLAATKQAASTAGGPFRSPTTALAETELQALVKRVIGASGGNLLLEEPLVSTRQNGFDRIALQCALTVPESRLKDLLYALETHVPFIFIDHVTIAMPVASQTDPGDSTAALEVRLIVHAYRAM